MQPAQIVRTAPIADQESANATAAPQAQQSLLSVRRLLCPACHHSLSTYSTNRRHNVIVRYHRCGHCGATSLRTHETPAGTIQFVGWARRSLPEFVE